MITLDLDKYSAVITDFDGTIVNSEPLHYKTAVKVLAEIGVKYPSFEVSCKKYAGTGYRHTFTSELRKHNLEVDMESLLLRQEEIYFDLVNNGHLKLVPGALEFLQSVKDKELTLALVSGSRLQDIEIAMETLEIPEIFDVIVTIDSVDQGKPDPESYELALDSMDLDAEECIVFEDSINGLIAAKEANLETIAIQSCLPEEKYKEINQDIIIKDFKDIKLEV